MEKIDTKEKFNQIGTEQKRVISIIQNAEYKVYIFVGRLGSNFYFANREDRRESMCLVDYEALKKIEKSEMAILFNTQHYNSPEIAEIIKEQEKQRHLTRMKELESWHTL